MVGIDRPCDVPLHLPALPATAIISNDEVVSTCCARALAGSIQYNEWVAALTDWKRLQSSPEWEEWAHAAFDSLVKDVEAGMCGTELEGIIQSSAGADGVCSSAPLVSLPRDILNYLSQTLHAHALSMDSGCRLSHGLPQPSSAMVTNLLNL